jgi:hypothetical protein
MIGFHAVHLASLLRGIHGSTLVDGGSATKEIANQLEELGRDDMPNEILRDQHPRDRVGASAQCRQLCR